MSDNPMPDDLVSNAPTRPATPRGLPTAPSGPAMRTTLPVVQWSEGIAVLQPKEMPRYETVDVLGRGGMGEVLRAHDNDIGRDVAVKRLRPDLQHPEHYARFVEEVRTVGQLEHPNIVPIHDAGVDAEGYFFVMKHVEGESLASIIRSLDQGDRAAHDKWPIERRMGVIRKVLDALRYAHSKGVIHRDIKPANILVGPMGEVFLLDWGIAKRPRSSAPSSSALPPTSPGGAIETQAGAVMGTPLYMSPEQARGQAVDARSDLYSLCVSLYEFLTLRPPFDGTQNTAQVLEAVIVQNIPFASMRSHPHQPFVTMDLGWLLRKGVAKNPEDRYQTADELIRRIDDWSKGKVPIQCHMSATKRLSYELVRLVNKSPPAYTLVLLGLIGGAIYWLVK